eukprot:TRINITY_DN10483_c0_g1_i2.p1 TRINITY_DN10483_c0_g1~~TRINITY_DN10483_c0_g1_i2.p1  ORF type:complete len:767 (+),score=124.88 TRINITY_DN10483_c0_g1_i2:96-2303(+)
MSPTTLAFPTLPFFFLLVVWTLFLLPHPSTSSPSPPIGSSWSVLEQQLLSLPDRNIIKANLKHYTSTPHVAGTKYDYETAVHTKELFEEYGLTNVRIDEHRVYLNYPISRSVKLVEPELYNATLREERYPGDLPYDEPFMQTFHGYAASGEASGEVVYANYGRLEDYLYLLNLNIDLKGKIIIVRYGKIYRGVKVMLAERYGAAGVLIYSDPDDDGISKGLMYPDGPFRPPTGVQRGSVQYSQMCPGDPHNPLCVGDTGKTFEDFIPSIPSQPISWQDAEPIMRNIGGPRAPSSPKEKWQDDLPFVYHIGPGPAVVELKLSMNFTTTPIWNVLGEIEGVGEHKDEYVMIGNHRDAWVYGAVDPSSGTATMMEVARTLSKADTAFERSVLFASWDCEEYGLVGSTAWSDKNGKFLSDKVVVYVNTDVAVSGSIFVASATPSLGKALQEVFTRVVDPNTQLPMGKVWDGELPPPGAGSDFVAPLQHYGVPSIDLGFSSDDTGGVYHSIHDNFDWMEKFGDPQFAYHEAMVQILNLYIAKFARLPSVPFDFSSQHEALQSYVEDLHILLSRLDAPPPIEINFHPLVVAIETFGRAARAHMCKEADYSQSFLLERQLLGSGLKGRPYYRHLIQAPGRTDGYGSQTFPGVRQEIEDENWEGVNTQIALVGARVLAAATFLFSDGGASTRVEPPRDKPTGIVIFVTLIVLLLLSVVGLYLASAKSFRVRKVVSLYVVLSPC